MIQSAFYIAVIFFTTWASPSFAVLTGGRYIGTLKYADTQREQLAKLELISVSVPEGETTRRAILTLHFGDFASREYVSFHFDTVRFVLPSLYHFSHTTQDMLISTTRATGSELEAKVSFVSGKTVGTLSLKKESPARPTLPLIEPVWGEYRGVCRGGSAFLQLYTFRSREKTDDVGNPFSAYEIRGSFARKAPLCPPNVNPFGRPCVTNNITSGGYNFYDGILNLSGTRNNFECTVDPKGLLCDGCLLKRVSKETTGPRVLIPPKAPAVFPDEPVGGPIDRPRGEFVGYVHHEYSNEFQLGRLRLTPLQTGTEEEGLQLASSANLYFGDVDEPGVSFNFDEQEVRLFKKRYVLARSGDADTDAVLVLNSVKDGVARGVWYSNLFGRVGSFEFRQDGLPKLPPNAQIVTTPAGRYENKYLHFIWDLNLTVLQGVSSVNTKDPFSPLIFSGYLWERRFLVEKTAIKGGSYDFYTGRIFVPFEGQEEGFFVGNREGKGNMSLKWVLQRTGIPLEKHELRPFRYRGRQ